MTPVELRRSSDRASATLQAMRDAAATADGLTVAPYDGQELETYQRIFDEWLRDLRAPDVQPIAFGVAIRYGR